MAELVNQIRHLKLNNKQLRQKYKNNDTGSLDYLW